MTGLLAVVLAHPLTEAAQLGVAPAFVGLAVGVLAVWISRVALAVAGGEPPVATTAPAPRAPLAVLTRVAGVGLLLLAVVAGRIGAPAQFDNITTALTIGVGWPALLLAAALPGRVWDHLNPFDTMARGADRIAGAGSRSATDPVPGALPLWPFALAGALAWTWWLAIYLPQGLDPRPIALALGVYTVITVAGCLWAGREPWMARAEIFTVTFRAVGASRTRGPISALPPRAYSAVMAVMIGGLAHAEVRFSTWYLTDLQSLGLSRFATPVVVSGYVLTVALSFGAVHLAVQWAARQRITAAVHALLPWLVVAFGLSAALERDRLWTSAQVLFTRISDPLGTGADVFGTADRGIAAWPYGPEVRLGLQIAVLVTAIVTGVVVATRRAAVERARDVDALRKDVDTASQDGPARADPAIFLAVGWLFVAVVSAATL
jgi:hypothetical protein